MNLKNKLNSTEPIWYEKNTKKKAKNKNKPPKIDFSKNRQK
jgi:hypothetical protein